MAFTYLLKNFTFVRDPSIVADDIFTQVATKYPDIAVWLKTQCRGPWAILSQDGFGDVELPINETLRRMFMIAFVEFEDKADAALFQLQFAEIVYLQWPDDDDV